MVEFKKCSGECGLEKELNSYNFYWRNDSKKFGNKCKICFKKYVKEYNKKYNKEYYKENTGEIKKYKKKWYQKNKKEILTNKKEYYEENKDEILKNTKEYYEENKKEILTNRKEYRQENKDEILKYQKEYQRNRRKNDLEYKLHKNISTSIYNILKNKKGGKSVLKHLPYTMKELRKHIEDQFKKPGNEWMTWDNWGVYDPKTHKDNPTWNLDHIKPHSDFHYEDMLCKEFQDCWALSNLRPLDSEKNLMDGATRVRHAH